MPAKRDLRERFWEKANKNGPLGCWVWTASKMNGGYGQVIIMNGKRGRPVPAHRVAWELANGAIPDGKYLDHLCRNRACVNPAHLQPVSNAENILRGVSPSATNKRKTHCIHGHKLTEDNIYRPPKRPHTRQCRSCIAIRLAKRGSKNSTGMERAA